MWLVFSYLFFLQFNLGCFMNKTPKYLQVLTRFRWFCSNSRLANQSNMYFSISLHYFVMHIWWLCCMQCVGKNRSLFYCNSFWKLYSLGRYCTRILVYYSIPIRYFSFHFFIELVICFFLFLRCLRSFYLLFFLLSYFCLISWSHQSGFWSVPFSLCPIAFRAALLCNFPELYVFLL